MEKDAFIPREDYRELCELALMILGEWTLPSGKNFTFKAPGAYHMARWMAKIIYCFKIYLFRDQFQMTPSEEKSLKEFGIFCSLIYVKAWISCPLASDAPINDLFLYRQIKDYSAVNKTVADIAAKKFQNHLWYQTVPVYKTSSIS